MDFEFYFDSLSSQLQNVFSLISVIVNYQNVLNFDSSSKTFLKMIYCYLYFFNDKLQKLHKHAMCGLFHPHLCFQFKSFLHREIMLLFFLIYFIYGDWVYQAFTFLMDSPGASFLKIHVDMKTNFLACDVSGVL